MEIKRKKCPECGRTKEDSIGVRICGTCELNIHENTGEGPDGD